ncbi:MAG: pitrilysin family protein [Myxococcota bacterium]|nr:pitrilysin family protein [Myxococcota bacterium]
MIGWLILGCGLAKAPVETNIIEDAPVSEIPVPGVLPSWLPGTPEVQTLENGLTLWVLHDSSIPLVSARLVLPGGSVTDPPEAWGFSWLAAEMLEESTEKRGTAELAGGFKLLGANMSVDVEKTAVVASLDILADRFEEGLGLLAEAVLQPAFEEGDWDRVKGLHLESIEQRWEEGRSLAQDSAGLTWYGADNPMGWPERGTPESVARVYRERVRDSMSEWVVPTGSTLVVVGDADVVRVRSAVEGAFGAWEGAPSARVVAARQAAQPSTEIPDSRFLLLDMPGAAQTAIRVVGRGPGAGEDTYTGARLAGILLGGSFTSRLNLLLREEKGYTYGARALYYSTGPVGMFVASTSVQTEVTAPALTDLVAELGRFGPGFTTEEAGKARAQVLANALDVGESRSALADRYASSAAEGLEAGEFAAQLQQSSEVQAQDLDTAVSSWFAPENLLFVLAGDAERVGNDLSEAGFSFQVVEPPR